MSLKVKSKNQLGKDSEDAFEDVEEVVEEISVEGETDSQLQQQNINMFSSEEVFIYIIIVALLKCVRKKRWPSRSAKILQCYG